MVRFDLLLHPASGPGLGHIMRCVALAQSARHMGMSVLFVADTDAVARMADKHGVAVLVYPECGWHTVAQWQERATCSIFDGTPAYIGNSVTASFIDYAEQEISGDNGVAVFPHYGATPKKGCPTYLGPQWMPLRTAFDGPEEGVRETGPPLVYRGADRDRPLNTAWGVNDLTSEELAEAMRRAPFVVTGPSTFAYEAIRMGTPVLLTEPTRKEYMPIYDAMIANGVADPYSSVEDPHEWAKVNKDRAVANAVEYLRAPSILEYLI